MLNLNFALAVDRSLKILCLGAHSDDIEIGCGGTILRLLSEFNNAEVYWVVLGSSGQRSREAITSANNFLVNAKKKRIIVKDYKESFFPYIGGEIKAFFEGLKAETSPDVIFTHYHNDLHQDHRLISELTWNTYRDHLILEYEIVKYDGDIGNPNFFIHLDEETCRRKIEYIFKSFKSQMGKRWFTEDTFYSILRLRGIESNSPYKYAEAFSCKKAII
jgi:LmbE family N-acetylglucosaminyl deacetylase